MPADDAERIAQWGPPMTRTTPPIGLTRNGCSESLKGFDVVIGKPALH